MTELLTITPERPFNLSEGLDFYKPTMGQVALENYPDAEVTFTMKNRSERLLSEFVSVDELNARFEAIRDQGFTPEEIAYYAGLTAQDGSARFDAPYLDFLADLRLPPVNVGINPETKDLAISTTGPWAAVSLWETVVMSEVNEQYYANLIEARGLSMEEVWAEGDRRLDEKIARLKERPDIKFADFGTRRRFSAPWHQHVVERFATELPDNFVGTSNPYYAHKFGLKPIGTYAHEMPMVYAAIEDAKSGQPLLGHRKMMEDWFDRYGPDLSIGLTDTFGSDFFFADFSEKNARRWNGLRHDSGNPIDFGEKTIDFYIDNDIDPGKKTIVFSDGLNVDKMIILADQFNGRINVLDGVGTDFTNDMGLPVNNFVMKATHAGEKDTVKISDDEGKHTGPIDIVKRYQTDAARVVMLAEAMKDGAYV